MNQTSYEGSINLTVPSSGRIAMTTPGAEINGIPAKVGDKVNVGDVLTYTGTASTHKDEDDITLFSAPSKRGFAAMDPAKQREISSKGGRAAHEKGTAHQFTEEEARAAGSKGGRAVSQNREHMAAIGRKGGKSRGAQRALSVYSALSGARC